MIIEYLVVAAISGTLGFCIGAVSYARAMTRRSTKHGMVDTAFVDKVIAALGTGKVDAEIARANTRNNQRGKA